jgi:hypothetical protein
VVHDDTAVGLDGLRIPLHARIPASEPARIVAALDNPRLSAATPSQSTRSSRGLGRSAESAHDPRSVAAHGDAARHRPEASLAAIRSRLDPSARAC